MNKLNETLLRNWHAIGEQVHEIAVQAGRDPTTIRIVGVTKYGNAAVTRALAECGCLDLGESRPQSLWEKAPLLNDLPVRWHLIGHLQRNKVARTLPLVWMLHSLDSLRLAESLSMHAMSQRGTARVLLEVNLGNESAKGGFAMDQVEEALGQVSALPGITICGLMGMASLQSSHECNLDQARREFARLRTCRDQLRDRGLPEGCSLDELSMGMSGDFPAAIIEGSTILRIGSRLFEGVEV